VRIGEGNREGGYRSSYRPDQIKQNSGKGKWIDSELQAEDADAGTYRYNAPVRSIRTDNPNPDDSDEADISLDTELSPKQADDIKKKILHIAELETAISTRTVSRIFKDSDEADVSLEAEPSPKQADEGGEKHLHDAESKTTSSTRINSQILEPFSVADFFQPRRRGLYSPQADHGDEENLHNAESQTNIPTRTYSPMPKGSDGADICLGSGPSLNQAEDGNEKDLHEAESRTMDPAVIARLKVHEGPSVSNPSKTAIQALSEEEVLPVAPVHALRSRHSVKAFERLSRRDSEANEFRRSISSADMSRDGVTVSGGLPRTYSENALFLPLDLSSKTYGTGYVADKELFRRASRRAKNKLSNARFRDTEFDVEGDLTANLIDTVNVSSKKVDEEPNPRQYQKYMLPWSLFLRARVQHESHLVFHTERDAIPSSFANKLKGMVQSKLKRRVMWWPLSPVHADYDPNQTLVSWECVSTSNSRLPHSLTRNSAVVLLSV
jgi:hypothetical protein